MCYSKAVYKSSFTNNQPMALMQSVQGPNSDTGKPGHGAGNHICHSHLHVLIDCNPALVWVAGPDSRCTHFNKSWLDFTGRTLEQDLGDGWTEIVHPEDLDRCVGIYQDAFHSRRPFTMEYRLRRADGVYRWVQGSAAPCHGDDGTFIGYIGSCNDVTEQRRALVESEERFRLLVDGVKEYAIVTLDTEGRVMSWNAGAERITGYASFEAIGRTCSSFFTPEEQAAYVPEQLFRTAERDGHLEVEGWLVRKDGSRFLACSSITALRDESGALRGFGKVVRDISEKRALETELLRAKDDSQMLVDVSPLAIVLLDHEGRVLLWNSAAERLFGWCCEEILGTCAPFIPDEEKAKFWSLLSEELRGERRDGMEVRRLRKDGTLVDLAVWTAPYYDGNDEIRGTLRVYADVSERNLTLARLQEANNRLHRLSERILEIQEDERRHIARELHDEIGQALTAVKLKLEATAQSCVGKECRAPIVDSVAICDSALVRVKRLFLGLRPPQLDDLGLVAAVRWHLDQQAREAGFSANFSADELPRLAPNLETTVFRLIQEAVTNIARHAHARHVWVELRGRSGLLQLKVRDDGDGFDAVAVQATLARSECMGLSGMEERVRLSGGQFDVRAEPGKGTMIWAAIPISFEKH